MTGRSSASSPLAVLRRRQHPDPRQELPEHAIPREQAGGGTHFGAQPLLFTRSIGQVGDLPGCFSGVRGVQHHGILEMPGVLLVTN